MVNKKEMAERGGWDSWLEFLFSALGSMVGLGNIWRFPYVCYRSGGGAFLIPFFVSMIVCGCPLIFLETAFCQFSNLGPGKVWVICPLFKGIGFSMMTITFVVSVYYTVIMAWTLYYAVASFRSPLPWTRCMPGLSSTDCMVPGNDSSRADFPSFNFSTLTTTVAPSNVTAIFDNVTTPSLTLINSSLGAPDNAVVALYKSREEAFWFKHVLDVSSDLSELGEVQWHILLCLLVAWVVVFLCLIRGIKSMGKVVYVAATVPYIILTCLLIRGCLLPGAGKGIYFYLVPVWDKLLDFQVWRNAATQVFFSMGMGFGLISTLASYNKFNNNCYRDALILPILDCGTSVFAGIVIFTFLGYMADMTGKSVDQVAQEGPGLVFVAYPAVLSTLPLPQLWSVLFFAMLFCVGLDSQFMHVQAVCTALSDCFPDKLMSRKTLLTLTICLVSLLLGIPLTMQGGFHLLNLIDWYIASFSVMFIVFVEVMVLAWIYGTDRLFDDIQAMIGHRPSTVWKFAWKFAMPIFIIVLWLSGLFNFTPIGKKNSAYPSWADGVGLVIGALPILPVPIKMAWTLCMGSGSFRQRLRHSLQPSPKWQPDCLKVKCAKGELATIDEETALN